MTVVYSKEALETLFEISDFVDSIYTGGAGERWLVKLTKWVSGYAKPAVTYSLCRNRYLASLGFSCINYNDWIIVFAIEEETFIVYKVLEGVYYKRKLV